MKAGERIKSRPGDRRASRSPAHSPWQPVSSPRALTVSRSLSLTRGSPCPTCADCVTGTTARQVCCDRSGGSRANAHAESVTSLRQGQCPSPSWLVEFRRIIDASETIAAERGDDLTQWPASRALRTARSGARRQRDIEPDSVLQRVHNRTHLAVAQWLSRLTDVVNSTWSSGCASGGINACEYDAGRLHT